MGEIAYVNGRLTDVGEASVSVQDRGLLYGDGLFETIRVYGKRPFQLDAHIDRLSWGARKIQLDLKISQTELKRAVLETIRANEYPEAVARLTVTRGLTTERMKITPGAKQTIIVTVDEFTGYPRHHYESGVEVVTVTDGRGEFAMVKSLNFLSNVLARHEADGRGAFEALLVTRRGFVMEGAVSNCFLLLDGILITPPVGERVMPGITRELVLDLARKNGISAKEDSIMNEELEDAEEMFMTNSLMEVMPVTKLDGHPVGNGSVGRVTQSLQRAYKDLTLR